MGPGLQDRVAGVGGGHSPVFCGLSLGLLSSSLGERDHGSDKMTPTLSQRNRFTLLKRDSVSQPVCTFHVVFSKPNFN